MAHDIKGEGKRQNRTFLPHSLFTLILQVRWTQYGINRPESTYSEQMVLGALDEYLKRKELVGLGTESVPSKESPEMDED